MIETMERSKGKVLGYKISGDATKADFGTLTPAVGAAIDAHGSVSLLLDLTDFDWEKVGAWKSEVDFGKQYQGKVDKIAVVGNKRWEKHLADVTAKYYAKDAKYFETDDDAWDWVES